MMQTIQIQGIAAVDADRDAQEIVVVFQVSEDQRLAVRIPAGAVGALALALRHKYPEVASPDQGTVTVMQPLMISAARPFSMPDGRVGLSFEIESFEIPLWMPEKIRDALRTSIDEVEALSKNPPKPRVN